VRELEALAIVWGTAKFGTYLKCNRFTVLTDHSSLQWLRKQDLKRGRLLNWAYRLRQYDFTIEYRKGADNKVADALSRLVFIAGPARKIEFREKLLVVTRAMERKQQSDKEHKKEKVVSVGAKDATQSQEKVGKSGSATKEDKAAESKTEKEAGEAKVVGKGKGLVQEGKDVGASQEAVEEKDQFVDPARSALWKRALKADSEYGKVLRALESKESPEWKEIIGKYPETLKKLSVENGVLLWHENGTKKAVVPLSQRRTLMALYHSTAHKSADETAKAIRKTYYWPGLHMDVKNYVKCCTSCILVKGDTKGQGLSLGWHLEPRALETIHLDFCGPLPKTKAGNLYILLMIDRCSGWLELIPTPDCKATTAASVFFKHWICNYGAPIRVITDNGTSFTGEAFKTEVNRAGALPLNIIPYFPQANGKAERRFREVGRLLKLLGAEGEDWDTLLPEIRFALHTTPDRITRFSPAEILLGRQLRNPHDFVESPTKCPLFELEVQAAARGSSGSGE
jgi:hypothetical protein